MGVNYYNMKGETMSIFNKVFNTLVVEGKEATTLEPQWVLFKLESARSELRKGLQCMQIKEPTLTIGLLRSIE